MANTELAYTQPMRFVTASEMRVQVGLTNLAGVGGATIYLHKERHTIKGAWAIAPGGTLAPIDWSGGSLWISTTADDVPFMRLVSEPGRAASQAAAAPAAPSSSASVAAPSSPAPAMPGSGVPVPGIPGYYLPPGFEL